jgi:hypothetical protein
MYVYMSVFYVSYDKGLRAARMAARMAYGVWRVS